MCVVERRHPQGVRNAAILEGRSHGDRDGDRRLGTYVLLLNKFAKLAPSFAYLDTRDSYNKCTMLYLTG